MSRVSIGHYDKCRRWSQSIYRDTVTTAFLSQPLQCCVVSYAKLRVTATATVTVMIIYEWPGSAPFDFFFVFLIFDFDLLVTQGGREEAPVGARQGWKEMSYPKYINFLCLSHQT